MSQNRSKNLLYMFNWPVVYTFCFPVLVPPFEKSNCKVCREVLFKKLVVRHWLLRHLLCIDVYISLFPSL